jgi:hypothetical protein
MALYYPPIKPNAPIYSFQNFEAPNTPVSPAQGGSSVTEEWLATHYLAFPNAQGVENFGFQELQLTSSNQGEVAQLYINPAIGQDVVLSTSQTDGSLTIKTPATTLNTMVLSPSTGLTFGDGTIQNTAFIEANYAQLNTNNTFLSPYINTFQGSNATIPSTGPLQISNVSTSEYASFYVDPSPTYDLTLYTAQTGNTAGLTVRNPNYSFSINPTVGNVASFVNPISSTYSITGQSFGVNTTGSEAYTIYSNTTPSNYGLVIANTTGNNGSLTLSNNGGTLTTITSTSTGLNIADPLSVDGTLTLGSSGVNATINTASANGITTLSNNNVNGGFTFNVNGGPLPTICNMLGTGFYIFNTLDMGDNNIVGLNKLGVSTGQTLSIVDGVTDLMTLSASLGINMFESIGMNSNNIIDVNQINGIGGNLNTTSNLYITGVVNVDTINGKTVSVPSLNTAPSYPDNTSKIATTSYVTTAINNIPTPSLSGYALLSNGGIQQWIGNNTCSSGIWDFQTGSTVLVQTVSNNTSNNTVASTAFVKANAGVFTQTSITSASSIYYSISPSPVNVITTYTSASNVVSFNSVQFNIVIGTVPTFLLANLIFSAPPFPGAPPPTQQTISMYCSNGATYAGTISWISSTQFYIAPPASINLSSGMTFSVNLSTLGAFTP